MSIHEDVKTRRDLFSLLQQRMRRTFDNVSEQQKVEENIGFVKTFVIETDWNTGRMEQPKMSIEDFIKNYFSTKPPKGKPITPIVIKKQEEGFFEVVTEFNRNEIRIYIDATTDSRFWFLFSTSHSSHLDIWLERIVLDNPYVDYAWLWPSLLQEIQNRGEFRGFGLDYDYRRFENFENKDVDFTTYLKMQLWGGEDARQVYKALSESLTGKIALSKIRMRESSPTDSSEDSDVFALQDLKFNGKFTVRGSSFEVHLGTLNYLRRVYSRKIAQIEDQFSLGWTKRDDKLVLTGEVLHFIPPDNYVIPVTLFKETALSGAKPFRLFGIIAEESVDTIVADVIDLHTGGKLSIEVYPDIISVYLYNGTCGNTIARLYTNLVHTLNSQFTVESSDGYSVFQPNDTQFDIGSLQRRQEIRENGSGV